MAAVDLRDATALSGALLGAAGFAVGAANYIRDRPRLRVTLQFDMEGYGNLTNSGPWVVVSIANTGRRPIYVSHVGLRPASRWKRPPKYKTLFVWGSQEGRRLQEGDPPWTVPGSQDEAVAAFTKRCRRVRAFVIDSAGRIYHSSPERQPVDRSPSTITQDDGRL